MTVQRKRNTFIDEALTNATLFTLYNVRTLEDVEIQQFVRQNMNPTSVTPVPLSRITCVFLLKGPIYIRGGIRLIV